MSLNKTTWGWIGLIARLAVAFTLIGSGLSKASAPKEEFAVVIEAYDVIPVDAAQSAAAMLPWVELLVGFSLLFGYFTPLASAGAGGMFMIFIAAIASTKARGIELPNCGCFGGTFHPAPSVTLMMDTLLLAACAAAYKYGADRCSLDNQAAQGYTGRTS